MVVQEIFRKNFYFILNVLKRTPRKMIKSVYIQEKSTKVMWAGLLINEVGRGWAGERILITDGPP